MKLLLFKTKITRSSILASRGLCKANRKGKSSQRRHKGGQRARGRPFDCTCVRKDDVLERFIAM